jgi:hypothetical protein
VFGSSGGLNVWDTAEVFTAEKLIILTSERIMHQAITPAFIEDYLFAIALPNIIMILVGIALYKLFDIDITEKKIAFTILLVFACAFSSLGYGGVVNGFATTHESVQGTNLGFYLYAWGFQTWNSLNMQLTGLFLPLAHFVNNALLAVSLSVGVVLVGGSAMTLILPTKYLVRK